MVVIDNLFCTLYIGLGVGNVVVNRVVIVFVFMKFVFYKERGYYIVM